MPPHNNVMLRSSSVPILSWQQHLATPVLRCCTKMTASLSDLTLPIFLCPPSNSNSNLSTPIILSSMSEPQSSPPNLPTSIFQPQSSAVHSLPMFHFQSSTPKLPTSIFHPRFFISNLPLPIFHSRASIPNLPFSVLVADMCGCRVGCQLGLRGRPS